MNLSLVHLLDKFIVKVELIYFSIRTETWCKLE